MPKDENKVTRLGIRLRGGKEYYVSSEELHKYRLYDGFLLIKEFCDYHSIPVDNRGGWK
jgi:hypothetical protein